MSANRERSEKVSKAPAFRSAFIDYFKRCCPHDNFDALDPAVRSKWMTRFYVNEVVRKLTPGLVPDVGEDIEQYLVDRTNDCGVDFIYKNENRVLIIQCKYHAAGKNESEADFVYFCEVLTRLTDTKEKKHEKLADIVHDVDFANDTFDLRFITLGRTTDAMQHRADGDISHKRYPEIDERADLRLINEQGLNEEFREALSAEKGIQDEIEIQFAKSHDGNWWVEFDGGGRRAFVGVVNGAQLANLVRRYKTRLFNLNIRNYTGDTSTNKGIAKTASESPENFFFYNNGLAAMATGIVADAEVGKIRCRQFSIVNGAQTAKSVEKAQRKFAEQVRKVNLLVRLSEVDLKETEFIAQTTKFNNTQNAVKISDFRSNDKVQQSLNAHFSRLSRGGKKFFYKNKRTEGNDNCIPVGMEEFAKTVYSFNFGPADCAGGASHLFDTSPQDGGYFKLFGDETQPLSQETFNQLAGRWFLCEKANEVLKTFKSAYEEGDDATLAKNALERRWLHFFAVGELLRFVYGKDVHLLATHLEKLAEPNRAQDEKVVAVIQEYSDASASLLMSIYKKDSAAEGFSHRNWFRDTKTLTSVRDGIRFQPMYKKLPRLIQK